MSSSFPPIPTYPYFLDSDKTLFKVHNTSQAPLSEDNNAYADQISVYPVHDDIWSNNGFANLNGELIYYDGTVRDSRGRVIIFTRCLRGINGFSNFNPAGSVIRGFVVAEQHNQMVLATILTEQFVGYNFTPDETTLDWRIRNLAGQQFVPDDFNCPEVQFDIDVTVSNSTGTTITYNVAIQGSYGSAVISFGDGITTSVLSGTHVYSATATIDPVVTVTNGGCTITQTPIERSEVTQPTVAAPTLPFTVAVPVTPTFPTLTFSTSLPSLPLVIPPVVTPCIDLSPLNGLSNLISVFEANFSFSPISINIPNVSVDLVLDVISIPPIEIIPISFPNIEIIVPSFPDINILTPSIIDISAAFDVNIITPSFPDINIATPSFPDINIATPSFPDINIATPSFPDINISFPDINISFPDINIATPSFPDINILTPSIIDISATFDVYIITPSFSDINIATPSFPGISIIFPSLPDLNFSPISFPEISIHSISFEPMSFIVDVSFENISFPLISFETISFSPIEFGPVSFPTVEFGPVSFPTVEFGPVSFPTVEFGPVSFPAVSWQSVPSFPLVSFQVPSVFPLASFQVPSVFPLASFQVPSVFPLVSFATPPQISINWGSPPSISCQCSLIVVCPSTSSSGGMFGRNMADYEPLANDVAVEYELGGIPSVISIIAPPQIRIMHDLPKSIKVDPLMMIIPDDFPRQISIIPLKYEDTFFSLVAPKFIEIKLVEPINIELKMPENLPFLSIDRSSFPDSIRVDGMISTISLIHDLPKNFGLSLVPDFKWPKLEVDPISVKIDFNIENTIAEKISNGETPKQCFALIPCQN